MRDCTASFGSKSPRNPILLKSHLFEKKVERILDKNPILLKSHLCGKVVYMVPRHHRNRFNKFWECFEQVIYPYQKMYTFPTENGQILRKSQTTW